MPHIIIKILPGRSAQQKHRLAELITKDVMHVLGDSEEWVTVGVEEVSASDWIAEVYTSDILNKWRTL